MSAADDPIRRGDAAALLCERCRTEAPKRDEFGLYHESSQRRYRVACRAANIYTLPADPVAEAAVRFAATTSDPWIVHGKSSDGLTYDGFKCRMCDHAWYPSNPRGWPTTETHAEVCPAGIYRAAVAARSAGTVPPAPSSGCHNDKPGDPCPCGANFERCPPAGTPPDGIVWPAPACARCGGSGRDSRAECRPVFDAASSRWVPEVIPCPECRGKP